MDAEVQTEKYWYETGMRFLNRSAHFKYRKNTSIRTFKQNFGCSPLVLMKCWDLLCGHSSLRGKKPIHLLWTCLFLKVYAKESINATMAGCDEKTFRKHTWDMIYAISDLEPEVVRLLYYVILHYM